ncbi:MAG TPA: epoxyqueuosine reductase QueH [Firmicutes bacterium]|nr:epoxyqueuosine reductase QueH [Candidatus Fermentithermobacillaceae bacterium]
MRVLLHSCCAPCSTFPSSILLAEGFRVDGLFFNPNIYPAEEEEKRWETYRRWAGEAGIEVRRIQWPHERWLSGVSSDLTKPGRCRECYRLRLIEVARLAREGGYDFFTTTLLVSPYQDHGGVVLALKKASEESGVPYLYRDFRVGYRRSREMARGSHLYMQTYCGCEFSLGGEA